MEPTKEKGNNNAGRKEVEVKRNCTMVVYFTEEEKKIVQEYCKKNRQPFSNWINLLIGKEGVL